MKKIIAFGVVITLLLCLFKPANAEEGKMEEVAKDAMWGGVIGVLVGGAVMALSKDPDEHWDYLLKGGAVGIIGGTLYGIFKVTTRSSIVSIDNKEVTVGIPLINIKPQLPTDAFDNKGGIIYSVNLFTYSFGP